VLGLNIGRLNADWSVVNMNPDMTPYMMSLDVCISQKKKIIIKICNKQIAKKMINSPF
jgi:hypothetical protein